MATPNIGLAQLTVELAPDIIIEELEDGFYQFVEQHNQWHTTPYTPIDDNNKESSHKFTRKLFMFESGKESNKLDFILINVTQS